MPDPLAPHRADLTADLAEYADSLGLDADALDADAAAMEPIIPDDHEADDTGAAAIRPTSAPVGLAGCLERLLESFRDLEEGEAVLRRYLARRARGESVRFGELSL